MIACTNARAALRPGWILAALLPLSAAGAGLSNDADGLVWNQRAWETLGHGDARQAAEFFNRAADRSATPASQAEAALGLGLAALVEGRPNAALDPLRRAALASPYAIAASAQLMAEAETALGDKTAAIGYLRQALDIDPYNREALRLLADLLDRAGDRRGAWQAARRAQDLDPGDAAARKIAARDAPPSSTDLDAAAGVRRIPAPALNPNEDSPWPISARDIRVGLFGTPSGMPAVLTHCVLMISPPFQTREISYRADEGAVEVRDASRDLLFASTGPFTFSPSSRRGSILIKGAAISETSGVDVGDREVRGSVDVIPTAGGFRLVQEVPLEPYLYGVVSLSLPDGSPSDALKAQAVVSRTAALRAAARRSAPPERFDLLDDRSTQATLGVSGEMSAADEAVRATAGLVLKEDGALARADQHDDSGGLTAEGIADARRPAPFDLDRFLHQPPDDLFTASAPAAMSAVARWTRVLDASDLRERAGVGRLRDLIVAARGTDGRVEKLEAVGSKGDKIFSGFDEIQALLSPHSLRSTLFALQPLRDGKDLARVVLWGAGTGSGRGFSRAGAVGQAELGADWRAILKHYFPKAAIAKE